MEEKDTGMNPEKMIGGSEKPTIRLLPVGDSVDRKMGWRTGQWRKVMECERRIHHLAVLNVTEMLAGLCELTAKRSILVDNKLKLVL